VSEHYRDPDFLARLKSEKPSSRNTNGSDDAIPPGRPGNGYGSSYPKVIQDQGWQPAGSQIAKGGKTLSPASFAIRIASIWNATTFIGHSWMLD